MKTDIFITNEEGLLEINKQEVRSFPNFRTILTRDKGGIEKGDYDGRRKLYAFKELMYIYLYYSPSSIFRDLPDKAKDVRCIEKAMLPTGWKADKVIDAAGQEYVEHLNMSAMHHSYINASRGIYAMGEDLKFFNDSRDRVRERLEMKIEELDNTQIEEDIQRLEMEVDTLTERLMGIGNRITTINSKLPSAYDSLEDIKKKLLKEQQGGVKITGGGELGNREEG